MHPLSCAQLGGVGAGVGAAVGLGVGRGDGTDVGDDVGAGVGMAVVEGVGATVGLGVGSSVGDGVGGTGVGGRQREFGHVADAQRSASGAHAIVSQVDGADINWTAIDRPATRCGPDSGRVCAT